MSKPSQRSPERKLQVVLSVLRGEVSVAEAARRQLAAARREVFVSPPGRRNRVRQADFTQFETTTEGTWRLCGVVDYATKVALACPVTTTQGAIDAAEALLGRSLLEDCVDEAAGGQ